MARSGGDALKQPSLIGETMQGRDGSVLFESRGSPIKHKLDRHGAGGLEWIDNIPYCPVFHPTKEQFKDPLQYLQSIAPQASKYGICKIVSPVVASVPATLVLTKEQPDFKFTTRVQPLRLANWDKDDKIKFYMSGRNYTIPEYEKMANKIYHRKFSTAASLPPRFVESEFWQEMVSGKIVSVEYACDIEGTAFSSSKTDALGQSKWNLKEISQLPESILRLLDYAIPGVTEPMMYIGMLFSTFAWHVEDHYLYSINYHHCGASKTWYGVPGHAASGFEKVVQEHVYDKEMLMETGEGTTYDLLIGKTTMFVPKLLADHGVPVFRAVQEPGEFVITFPRSYHAGFSHGFNCGEAVNFAMADWFPFGAAACRRYERLNRFPLLPHEELLCKEAICVGATEKYTQGRTDDDDDDEYRSYRRDAKVAFVSLMRFQRHAQEQLLKKGAQLTFSPASCRASCSLCKHSCYVAFVACKCFLEPICLNHGKELDSCGCGPERTLFIRESFSELEAIACMFESDEGVSDRASKEEEEEPVVDSLIIKGDDGLYENCANKGREGRDREEEFLQCHVAKHLLLDSSALPTTVTAVVPLPEVGCMPLMASSIDGGDDSESEAFRVKRRRISTFDKKPVVNGRPVNLLGGNGFQSAQPLRAYVTTKGDNAVLVRDVMRELDVKGSILEVVKKWQLTAKRKAITLKTHRVVIECRQHIAFSFKGCKCLRKILPEKEALNLKRMIDRLTH